MEKFCLIGHPLGHSLSPQIHEKLFALSGKQAEYSLLDIAPEELKNNYAKLDEFAGFNITIPHKIAIIDYCKNVSEGARRYNSVNCVKNENGAGTGHNTDCVGFVKSIEMMGAELGSRVLLIGCGGVGRMIAVEAALSGAELYIAALESDMPLAESVISEIHSSIPGSKAEIIMTNGSLEAADFGGNRNFDLLINATPVGMFPKSDRIPCEENVLDHVDSVFDVIYNPKETLLVKKAREKGKKALNGMAMLVLQAVAAHEIWYGAKFEQTDIDGLISEMENYI